MYLDRLASARRRKEAENARRNRLEIRKALTMGQIDRRDLFRWGIFTTTGMLAMKNGLSPFAPSAYAASIPTGAPPSPKANKFKIPMPRPGVLQPYAMKQVAGTDEYEFVGAKGELPARNYSYHEEFSQTGGAQRRNPVTNRGPIEGRPPGDFFKHQRWGEIPPKVGYLLSLGQVSEGAKFHPDLPEQYKNSVWSYGVRQPGMPGNIDGVRTGSAIPHLIRMRYDEPVLCRIYNDLPDDPYKDPNFTFGKNEISTHFHNAHNGAESDGACNAYHFPGTFYDYHWSAVVARRDMPTVRATSTPGWKAKCSTPTDDGGYKEVEGDFRELQGTMWFHDHRFFYTAENVHKGNFGLINMYSGPDRGAEDIADGVNLGLPSGTEKAWGNLDFDVNICITNPAFDQDGQLLFDIFDTDGFLGDVLAVNGAYYPYLEVLPRRYRFRILNAAMARFIRLLLVTETVSGGIPNGTKVPMWVIANDGNLLPKPIRLTDLDTQGVAERFDVIVDFSQFKAGDRLLLVNTMKHKDGRGPDAPVGLRTALRGDPEDPAVGPLLQIRVVKALASVDGGGEIDSTAATFKDLSTKFDNDPDWLASGTKFLTTQIPVEKPVRTRTIEFKRNELATSRDPVTGECIPDCGEIESFPWVVRVEGESQHPLNANRISALIPKPGEVEHWVLQNGGGGWDHPIHLHFEEGVTIDRAGDPIAATEKLARKDVWRLGQNGKRTVRMQVRFGEFGGAYVAHCHNTTHEDFAMLMRTQLLRPDSPQADLTDTPLPTRDGVNWKRPEILPEGDPRRRKLASK
jgi:FtsP/CotA-like multicopper oxidase with cupredoxin domain